LFLSRDELVEYDDDEYEDESLSCLLFVLDEILFTFLLLLLLLLLDPCLPSLSFDDEDVRDEDVVLLVFAGIALLDGALVLLFEYEICAFEFDDDDDEFFALLDFFCLLLDVDDDDDDNAVEGANGSAIVGRREDECDTSGSFSGDDGESLEFVSCEIGLYGGIGFTFPPFFYNRKPNMN
jgi:hypothetical protein